MPIFHRYYIILIISGSSAFIKLYMQWVVLRWVADCCNDHNSLMADSTISGFIHMFTVCYLCKQSMRCRGPLRACVGYRCVEGRWWLNIGGLDGMSSDSLYGMVIGAGMSSLAGSPGVGVNGVEYVDNCCVGGWGTWIGAGCTDAIPFLVSYTCVLCVPWGKNRWDVVVHCAPALDIGVWKAYVSS